MRHMLKENLREENIPSLPPFKVMSDEKLVEDLEPRESKLSKESSLLWLAEGGKGSPRSTYQISPYPLSLPLLFRWLDSSSAYESKFWKMFCNSLRQNATNDFSLKNFKMCSGSKTNFNKDYCNTSERDLYNRRPWISHFSLAESKQDSSQSTKSITADDLWISWLYH